MGKTIAIFNQKGGVGKTTTNINLAACLALKGKKVVILDIDPQGNTTSGVGIAKKGLEKTTYEILVDEHMNPADAIISTGVKNLYIIPASVQLAGAEIELVKLERREQRLKKAIDAIKDNYDYIFIDCPPSLGLLTINSLTAVDSVLIPIQCEFYALEGVSQLMSTIELVKKSLNPDLKIQGVILSMFDGRTNLSIQVVEEVKKYFREKVYTTVIPRNVRLAEAPSYGMPITEYDPRSTGAQAYMEFAEEFLELEAEDNG
ncbi:MAG: ParA family protein [Candidatus Fimenecus sp.]